MPVAGVIAEATDIVRLLGDVDASTVARIEAMHARVTELMEAIDWLWPEDGIDRRVTHPTSERVIALVDLLSDLREEADAGDEVRSGQG